jgi:hypothetical protein
MRDEKEILIRGPLGIWHFPMLNAILRLIQSLSGASTSSLGYQNVETITWTDWRGRERKIVIHRMAEAM